ncbi:hypothetical protein OT109_03035 [Phycisphaeraceae bacterium D3-23]
MAIPPTHPRLGPTARLLAVLLVVLLPALLVACNNTPDPVEPDAGFTDLAPDIPLPDLGPSPNDVERPSRIHAIVQRIDVPLDQSTDNAWAVTDELAFPAITRSIWHANGLRLGLLGEEDVEAFAQHMPEVLELFETQVYTSSHPVAVMRTPRLRDSVRIPVDLTLPPAPPHNETILGGDDGKLQLLARLEVEYGKTYVVLTPHHAQPNPGRLQPTDLLERELEGRMYDELAIRVELTDDRLLIVGLYWPWPIGEEFNDADNAPRQQRPRPRNHLANQHPKPRPRRRPRRPPIPPLARRPRPARNPARRKQQRRQPRRQRQRRPQQHRTTRRQHPRNQRPRHPRPGRTRLHPPRPHRPSPAPPLRPSPPHRHPRARKPVQTFLLISIPPAEETPTAPSIEDLNAQPAQDPAPPNDLASSPANSD